MLVNVLSDYSGSEKSFSFGNFMQHQNQKYLVVSDEGGGSPESAENKLRTSTIPRRTIYRNGMFLVVLLASCIMFAPPLVELYSLAQRQEHYSHIMLIPWISLYVFYLERKAILASTEWNPWMGALLMCVSALSYWTANLVILEEDYLSSSILSFVVMCWGMFFFFFGSKMCRRVSFGLLFLLFIVPFPSRLLDAIVRFLQYSSADVTERLFAILGTPVLRDGFLFIMSNFAIHVAEECSGIRSALSLFFTSLVAGHFFLRTLWGKMGIVAIVVPLAITKNALRIVALALLANYVDPAYITNSIWHRSGGVPLFLFSLLLLFILIWFVRRLEGILRYDCAQ